MQNNISDIEDSYTETELMSHILASHHQADL